MTTKMGNPKDRAAEEGNRVSLSIIPASALAALATALYEGHRKYRAHNWRVDGVRASVYWDACQRHMWKWWDGEESDPLTRVSHLSSAMASLAIIVDARVCGRLVDDRPVKGRASLAFEEASRTMAHLNTVFPGAGPRWTEVATQDNPSIGEKANDSEGLGADRGGGT